MEGLTSAAMDVTCDISKVTVAQQQQQQQQQQQKQWHEVHRSQLNNNRYKNIMWTELNLNLSSLLLSLNLLLHHPGHEDRCGHLQGVAVGRECRLRDGD